ncbi:Acyl carrier protein [Magnetospirillum sp. XM-1]|uniref:acyl carrier protein n=1 Tax=Magnetospirillum sp. XM-1 TaxID=1663591 RepID=UPI00073DD5F1|nr:acyl carrier protein [Magnetospirillum sp. XM-1]CUW38099.1 Acyl carrier protein [Magnetospirillum sp. XM-1]
MNIYERLTPIFQDVFDNDDVIATPTLTAAEVEGWDSLSHIRLVVAVESEFGIKFSISELTGLKNVGAMVALIEAKTS